MGLSIYVTQLEPTNKVKNNKLDLCITPYAMKGFGRSLLKNEKKYSEVIERELYLQMSYGFYNTFRDALSRSFLSKKDQTLWDYCSRLAKDEQYPNGLYHLINFADNQGFIGPAAVQELNQYFEDCKKKGTLKIKKDKLRAIDTIFVPYLNELIKMAKVASKKNAYLEFC